MHSFILQNWTTIRAGGSGTVVITQQETDWLDLAPYQDVVFWIDVKEVTGSPTPTLYLQTSPTRDDTFFQTMVTQGTSTGIPLAAAAAPTVVSAFMLTAAVPLARLLRWQISGSAPWDATFRIAVAANSPGM